jgi:hypothetical protein
MLRVVEWRVTVGRRGAVAQAMTAAHAHRTLTAVSPAPLGPTSATSWLGVGFEADARQRVRRRAGVAEVDLSERHAAATAD